MNYRNLFIKKALTLHNTVNIIIDGPCMSPLLEDGEKIQVKKAQRYFVGDIILYEDGRENLISHRINYIDKDVVITSGDNNLLFDSPINHKDILGKLTATTDNYVNSNTIVSMDYKTYLNSNIVEKHSIILLNKLSNEYQENEFIQFDGSLPSKKHKLFLIRGLMIKNIYNINNFNSNGHVIEKGIALF